MLLFSLFFITSGCSVHYSKPDKKVPVSSGSSTWRALEILGTKASFLPGQKIDVHFVLHKGDRRVSGSTGCNNFSGFYTRKGNRLSFHLLGTTYMACSPRIMAQERRFLQAMESVASYRLAGHRLTLFDRNGKRVMMLIRVQ